MFLQAEMRAAVFLAMEEQDKLEVRLYSLDVLQRDLPLRLIFFIRSFQKRAPVVNENLKRCLNTEDG